MARTKEEQQNFIVNTINLLVRRTGTAATAKVLTEAGVATRSDLRKLERMGVIRCIPVHDGNAVLNAYYTEGELPNALRPTQHTTHVAGKPSEGGGVG